MRKTECKKLQGYEAVMASIKTCALLLKMGADEEHKKFTRKDSMYFREMNHLSQRQVYNEYTHLCLFMVGFMIVLGTTEIPADKTEEIIKELEELEVAETYYLFLADNGAKKIKKGIRSAVVDDKLMELLWTR